MLDNKLCPICGSSEIGQGKQTAQGKMMPVDNVLSLGSVVIADI